MKIVLSRIRIITECFIWTFVFGKKKYCLDTFMWRFCYISQVLNLFKLGMYTWMKIQSMWFYIYRKSKCQRKYILKTTFWGCYVFVFSSCHYILPTRPTLNSNVNTITLPTTRGTLSITWSSRIVLWQTGSDSTLYTVYQLCIYRLCVCVCVCFCLRN